jgi:hypothetical protein
MGVITHHNQALEDLCTRIQTLNEEEAKTHDPLEQQEKFDEMQQVNNSLNALFEAQTVEKKELRAFKAYHSKFIPTDASG